MPDPAAWPRWPLLVPAALVLAVDGLLWAWDRAHDAARAGDDALADLGTED